MKKTVTNIIFLSIICISCLSLKQDIKSITILKGCDSQEALSDIELSVKNNEFFLKEHNIKIISSIKNEKNCGYLFTNGKQKKTIKGAETDVDLLDEIKKFYNIK